MDGFVSLLISAVLQLLLFALIPFIWWLITARKTSFFAWIGITKPRFDGSIFKTCAICIGGAAAYTVAVGFVLAHLLGTAQTATSQFAGQGIKAIPSILVYAVIQTGLSEELFFRGFLCKRLSNKFGFALGNTIQAICFGLLHGIPFGVATGNPVVCILLTMLPAGMGYLEGWLNEKKAGGSVVPSWALHALMNALSALSSI